MGDVHGAALLADDIADRGRREERPDLVLNGGDGFDQEAVVIGGELALPKRQDDWVGTGCQKSGTVGGIGEETGKPEESRAGRVEEKPERVVEDVFEPWPPAIAP